jgi:copper oxidase (laccase) domain-containing protein
VFPVSSSESFAALSAIPGLVHGFVLRDPGVPVDDVDKEEALTRLRPFHERAMWELGIEGRPLVTAEQVHGAKVALVDEGVLAHPERWPLAGVDELITDLPEVALGIHVADCGAVYLVDPIRRTLGLVHSGRKGTELGIVTHTMAMMELCFGSRPQDLVVQLGPCIRPPAYEVDFAASIRNEFRVAGVPPEAVHDCGVCTSSDLGRYYSYRVEKGKTGRHLAVAAWRKEG